LYPDNSGSHYVLYSECSAIEIRYVNYFFMLTRVIAVGAISYFVAKL